MYRLISQYGNRIVYTNDERRKQQLLDKGFKIDEKKTDKPKRRKAVKVDDRAVENKD